MLKYTIIIERCENNYSTYCPDLPGCIAMGSTVEETVQMMREAIELHLEGLRNEWIEIPAPSTEARSVDMVVKELA
jgi:Uncharacterized conserved protein